MKVKLPKTGIISHLIAKINKVLFKEKKHCNQE